MRLVYEKSTPKEKKTKIRSKKERKKEKIINGSKEWNKKRQMEKIR